MSPLWRNWAGDQRCAPHSIEHPAGEAEVVEALGRAADVGRSVRVAASGHSFTDIACTDGHMLSLDRMDAVLDSDADTGLVRVQSGITLSKLGRELSERGLAMENQGDIDAQQLGGAISTATHGTGLRFPNLSAQVAALRLVTAAGEVLDLSADSDPDAFLAARVGLGALGVITEVTLQAVPRFVIHRVDERRPLDETLAALESLAEESDHFEFYAFPYSDRAFTRTSERREGGEPEPESALLAFVREGLLENRVVDLAGRVGRALPGSVPQLNRRLAALVGRSVKTDYSYRVYASRREVRFTEMEYAIPRAAGAEAVHRVLDMVERRELPITFPLEVRVTAPDDAFLSTAHGRETCYVAVHAYRGTEFESYFRGVEAIMGEYGGRPHWGKRHYQTAASLRERYPQWDRFQAVRSRLDPTGLFRNDYTDRVLGR